VVLGCAEEYQRPACGLVGSSGRRISLQRLACGRPGTNIRPVALIAPLGRGGLNFLSVRMHETPALRNFLVHLRRSSSGDRDTALGNHSPLQTAVYRSPPCRNCAWPSRWPQVHRACVGSLCHNRDASCSTPPRTPCIPCAAASRASAPRPVSVYVTSTFTSSPRQRCGSIFPRIALISSRPSRILRRGCWSWTRSCGCTGSTRTPAARSRRFWPIYGNCSDAIILPSCLCITPKRAAAVCAPGKRCADRQSSMRGATRTFTCAATDPNSRLPSSIVRHHPRPPSTWNSCRDKTPSLLRS
jgi:hypothetical protein